MTGLDKAAGRNRVSAGAAILALLLAIRPWSYFFWQDLRLGFFLLDNSIVAVCLGLVLVAWLVDLAQRDARPRFADLLTTGGLLMLGQWTAAAVNGFARVEAQKSLVNQTLVASMFLALSTANQRSRLLVVLGAVIGTTAVAGSVVWDVLTSGGTLVEQAGLVYQRTGGLLSFGWMAGPLLMVGCIVCVVLRAQVRSSARGGIRPLVDVALLVNCVGLLFSGSRAAVVGFFAFVVLLAFRPTQGWRSIGIRFSTLTATVAVIGAGYYLIDPDGLARLLLLFDPWYYSPSSRESTVVGRLEIFRDTLDAVVRGKPFGHGLEAYEGDSGSSYTWFLHNSGLFGLAAWGVFAGRVTSRGWTLSKAGGPWLFATVGAMLMCSFGEVIWTDNVRGLYVLAILALLFWPNPADQTRANRSHPPVPALSPPTDCPRDL